MTATRKSPAPSSTLQPGCAISPAVQLHLHLEGTIEPGDPGRALPPPRPRPAHPRRRPRPLYLRRLPRIPRSLQIRNHTPLHSRRLRAHHLQHGSAPSPPRASSTPRSTSPSESSITGSTPRSNPSSRPSSAAASAASRSSAPPSTGSSTPYATSAPKRPPASSARPPNYAQHILYRRHRHRGRRGAEGPASQFKALFAEARDTGLRLTAHAGETGGIIEGPASIWSAINIGAERIGHALAAHYDAELMQVLAQRQIPVEINVTSNLRTGRCPSLDYPPCAPDSDLGLMVTLNSDDPPMFGASCSTSSPSPTPTSASPSTSSASSPPTPSKPASSPPPASSPSSPHRAISVTLFCRFHLVVISEGNLLFVCHSRRESAVLFVIPEGNLLLSFLLPGAPFIAHLAMSGKNSLNR